MSSAPIITSRRSTIGVFGAREHNLKDLTIEIPRDRLVVVTGVSGSGKSSLVFDTIYAEGQRRYLESLSSHGRRLIRQVPKPDVDFVLGLSPVISVDQKSAFSTNPRSTVGTMTDLSNYLNLLFAKIAAAHCPRCLTPLPRHSSAQLAQLATKYLHDGPLHVLAPIHQMQGGPDLGESLNDLRQQGYRWVWLNGERVDSADVALGAEGSDLCLLINTFSPGTSDDAGILQSLIEAAEVGEGFLGLVTQGQHIGPCEHSIFVTEIEPSYFMFNSVNSRCGVCLGSGFEMTVDDDLLVEDHSKSLREGINVLLTYDPERYLGWLLYSMAKAYGFSLDTPFRELTPLARDTLINGTDRPVELVRPADCSSEDPSLLAWEGKQVSYAGLKEAVNVQYRFNRTNQSEDSTFLRRFMREQVCGGCLGSRLKTNRNLFTLEGLTMHQASTLGLKDLGLLLERFRLPESASSAAQIAGQASSRIAILERLGLEYLSLNRRSSTLAGGEAQRVRISSQIGSGLQGMLYVLDEPTIGLHAEDTGRMIEALRLLRDLGNTLILVEHDERVIREADYVFEMGPLSGASGGAVTFSGTTSELLEADVLTGHYLSGKAAIPSRSTFREPSKEAILVRAATHNNLKKIDVKIPLGRFVCVTGVSGSGKSSLIIETLFKGLLRHFGKPVDRVGEHEQITGCEAVTNAIIVNQRPMAAGRRSIPATYLHAFDEIRRIFVKAATAQGLDHSLGQFSFNSRAGRCDHCLGHGSVLTRLYFMPDVEVQCPLCNGMRFSAKTLQARYKDHSIGEVLNLTVDQALAFFETNSAIVRRLQVAHQVGLGYIPLGRSTSSLSGGEAQRLRLATALGSTHEASGNMYILDEPTTGLHLHDISRLLDVLNALVDRGNSLIVVEHHLDVIANADHVIDLGPGPAEDGGNIVAQGTPMEVMASEASVTGRHLRLRHDSHATNLSRSG